MSNPYVGEIRMFGGNFAPAGWAFCDGAVLPISENDVLFQLIGTTYGGDGQSTFALPDLRGRVPVHQGGSHVIGEASGSEDVTLTVNQIPTHSHYFAASMDAATGSVPVDNVLGSSPSIQLYTDPDPSTPPSSAMANQMLAPTGGSQPHTNMQPYLTINYIISLFGVFPSQT